MITLPNQKQTLNVRTTTLINIHVLKIMCYDDAINLRSRLLH